jgi:hypothetical protein
VKVNRLLFEGLPESINNSDPLNDDVGVIPSVIENTDVCVKLSDPKNNFDKLIPELPTYLLDALGFKEAFITRVVEKRLVEENDGVASILDEPDNREESENLKEDLKLPDGEKFFEFDSFNE